MPRHFLDLTDLTSEEAWTLLRSARTLKSDWRQGRRPALLSGRTLGLIFEKPSLRTRVSFETAIVQLGGGALFLNSKDVGFDGREPIADISRVVSRYLDVLALRTFQHETLTQMASSASIPIINALSDESHPCQAMADMLTIAEVFGELEGRTVVFVGDGNNVARSLAEASAHLGLNFILACPAGYEFPASFLERFRRKFAESRQQPRVINDPRAAVREADVVYTDVWASMGQESQSERRRADFAAYQVDESLFALARPDAIFLHCLPAHRGEEVTSAVLDGPRSRVLDQAENRMHFQKALLTWLLS